MKEQLLGMLCGLALISAIDLAVSPIIVRAAVAAFNAIWRLFSPAPAAPKRSRTEDPLTDKPVKKKKRKKSVDAYPEPSGGEAVLIALLTIGGTMIPGFALGFIFPVLADALTGSRLLFFSLALRWVVQSCALTAVLSTSLFRSVGVAILDTLVRVLLFSFVILVAGLVLEK